MRVEAPYGRGTWTRCLLCVILAGGALRDPIPYYLPTGPGMVMLSPVPMRVSVGAPMVIAPMVAVVPSAHHNDGRGSDHDGRWDAEADVDIDAGEGGLRLRE